MLRFVFETIKDNFEINEYAHVTARYEVSQNKCHLDIFTNRRNDIIIA